MEINATHMNKLSLSLVGVLKKITGVLLLCVMILR
jgi:hypothetical protein